MTYITVLISGKINREVYKHFLAHNNECFIYHDNWKSILN